MKEKLSYLNLLDLCILTVIFFGTAIYGSTIEIFSYYFSPESIADNHSIQFSDYQNISALIFQLVLLSIAIAYLKWRNFDFTQLHFSFSIRSIFMAILLFILIAIMMDIYFYIIQYIDYWIYYEDYQQDSLTTLITENNEDFSSDNTSFISLWLVLYSLLNGFYEEIFFLGLCLCVKPDYQKWAFLFSLLIRFSFHTYQGIESALGITLVLGVTFYLLFKRSTNKNLVPFALAHSLGDVFGVGILAYFYY